MSETPVNRFEAYAKHVPLVICLGFLVAGIGLMAQPAFAPKTVWFSQMWFYGAFFALAALAGMLALRLGWRRLALGLVYLMIADIALATASRELNRFGLGENLMPRRTSSIIAAYQYDYHPLLVITPRANYIDRAARHTAFGTRLVGDAMTLEPGKPRLVVIGGSTTYDITASQGATWPEMLQKAVPEMQVVNYGVGGYTTSEHVIQTAYYLPRFEPACVIYYFGWNDIRNAHVPGLDPAFADFHLRNKIERLQFYRDPSFTAIMKLAAITARRLTGLDLDLPRGIDRLPAGKGVDSGFDGIYRANLRTMIALNQARGVRTGFVGQLFSHAILAKGRPETRDGYMPGLAVGDYAATMDSTNAALAEEAKKANVPVLIPDQGWLPADGFVDFGHFTDKGSAAFAARITGFVRETCGLK